MDDISRGVASEHTLARRNYTKSKNMYGIEQWDFTYATF